MSEAEWDACSWDIQQAYLDGMAEAGLWKPGEPGEKQDEDSPFSHRKVDSGSNVIDLQEMIRQSKGA